MVAYWREWAGRYLSDPRHSDVPDPVASAHRLSRLATQLEVILLQRANETHEERTLRLNTVCHKARPQHSDEANAKRSRASKDRYTNRLRQKSPE